jgi:hypothetical protein
MGKFKQHSIQTREQPKDNFDSILRIFLN